MNAQLSNGHLYASLILVTVDPREVYSANAGIWKSKDFFKTSLRENTRPAGTAGTPRATRRSSIISIMKKLPYAICIHMLCLILDGLPQELTYFHPFIRWFKHITHKPKQGWLKWKVSVILYSHTFQNSWCPKLVKCQMFNRISHYSSQNAPSTTLCLRSSEFLCLYGSTGQWIPFTGTLLSLSLFSFSNSYYHHAINVQ